MTIHGKRGTEAGVMSEGGEGEAVEMGRRDTEGATAGLARRTGSSRAAQALTEEGAPTYHQRIIAEEAMVSGGKADMARTA